MCGEHRRRNEAAQQSERVEQFEQPAALVLDAQVTIDEEGNTLQKIAEGNAEYHAWHQPGDEHGIIPERAPLPILDPVVHHFLSGRGAWLRAAPVSLEYPDCHVFYPQSGKRTGPILRLVPAGPSLPRAR